MDIQPLDMTVFAMMKSEGTFERIGKKFPLLGRLISNRTWTLCHRPIKESIVQILASRPIIDASIWGDVLHQEVALFLCLKVKEEIGWPNGRFIPTDSVEVILWMCEDDLEIVEIVLDIEDRFKIKISDDRIQSICKGTMNDFVDQIASLMLAAEPE